MKQSRLWWLVAVTVVLAILRVLAPSPGRETAPAVAEAIVRKPSSAVKPEVVAAAARPAANKAARGDELDTPGDAFAVRPPPPPPYVPPVVVAKGKPTSPSPAPVPVVAVAQEPPLPPMPYQVIGTWDDGKAPGVFLSSPTGTVLARPGMTLQAEYQVNSITAQQIVLIHLATKREVRLAVPRPPPTPNLALRTNP